MLCFFYLNSLVSISLNVFVMKRSTISSRSCGARPSAQQNHSPTPTSGRSPPSPTTASNFRTESLVSQDDLAHQQPATHTSNSVSNSRSTALTIWEFHNTGSGSGVHRNEAVCIRSAFFGIVTRALADKVF